MCILIFALIKSGTKPAGKINFREVEAIETDVDMKSKEARGAKKGRGIFRIVVKSNRSYLIQGDNSAETAEWIDTLKRAFILYQRTHPKAKGKEEEGFSEEESEEEKEEEVAARPRGEHAKKRRPPLGPKELRQAEVLTIRIQHIKY